VDDSLIVQDADAVTLILTASTDHRLEYPQYTGRDFEGLTAHRMEMATQKKYGDLLQTHIDDHSALFGRVHLDLAPGVRDTIPTDKRLQAFVETRRDPHLVELAFQYGRYLLMASSRPGSLPANLQGVWANKIQTPWNGDYHTDVNIEMNYWPAEVTNLPETHLPLFDLITSLVEPGQRTAEIHYNADGWVVHPITNVWGYTSPGERASWGMHTGAGAWICQHIMEHYVFTGDTAFLQRMFPVLEGSVRFYMDWLVKHPDTGKLVSGPAVSPENTFIAPDGSNCQISMGPAHDQQVIWQLFTDYLKASEVLGTETAFTDSVSTAKSELAGPQIGSDGRLMEWAEEFPEAEPGHRHISHLFALHPGAQISTEHTPELARAAKRSLDHRIEHGGGHTGWSAAWLVSQYARLEEAEQAKQSLDVVLSKNMTPNLFAQHPPFQMDANFGVTAGIAEMLLQSHADVIHLLPALPEAWPEGTVQGLRARGGLTVELVWKDGILEHASLSADQGGLFNLKYGTVYLPVALARGEGVTVILKNGQLTGQQ
jgi:alpha-L-fucosidase 2